jgi:hypothetical protein
MDVSLASWLVVALALAAANLPFFNDAVFGVMPLKAREAGVPRRKHFVVRLLELVVLYFVVGAVATMLEARSGTVAPQTWEFYAITACLFAVLAFPGFVVRYLRKQRP